MQLAFLSRKIQEMIWNTLPQRNSLIGALIRKRRWQRNGRIFSAPTLTYLVTQRLKP